jgi:hypothetical protein
VRFPCGASGFGKTYRFPMLIPLIPVASYLLTCVLHHTVAVSSRPPRKQRPAWEGELVATEHATGGAAARAHNSTDGRFHRARSRRARPPPLREHAAARRRPSPPHEHTTAETASTTKHAASEDAAAGQARSSRGRPSPPSAERGGASTSTSSNSGKESWRKRFSLPCGGLGGPTKKGLAGESWAG